MNTREVMLRRRIKQLETQTDLFLRLIYGLAGAEPVAIRKQLLLGDKLTVNLDFESDPNHVLVGRVSPPPEGVTDKQEICSVCGVPMPPGDDSCPVCDRGVSVLPTLEEQLELPLFERS